MYISLVKKIEEYKDKIKLENAIYIMQVLSKRMYEEFLYRKDTVFGSGRRYSETKSTLVPIRLTPKMLDTSYIDISMADELARMYMDHRFDLLGSGWTRVDYSDNAKGLENHRYAVDSISVDLDGVSLKILVNRSNLKNAEKIQRYLDSEYKPIDWSKDFISGFRWSNSLWYKLQRVANRPGGDIKVPWELSRMQHLPRLAVLCMIFPEKQDSFAREFRNQLLDFMSVNPRRFGVDYACTMDVGIRTANVALAYSLFKCFDVSFDDFFERELCNFLFIQCDHIKNNLEWSKFLTSNHYFADIAGLLWGSTILPDCSKKYKWMQFAAEELNKEIIKQYNTEGSNGEGSTAYHRLTSEMAIYSLALIKYLNSHGYSVAYDKDAESIIKRSAGFSNDIIRPDAMFTQIGDNDSGLFFRLSITGKLITVKDAKNKYRNLEQFQGDDESPYLDENMNDCRTFLSAAYGMFGSEKLKDSFKTYPLECSLVRQLTGDVERCTLNYEEVAADDTYDRLDESEVGGVTAKYNLIYEKEFIIDSGVTGLLTNIKRIDYHQFGVYIFKSDKLYLCVNATDNGQKGNAGHAHNDKLSFELFVDGKCLFEDPGTYVYTSLPDRRNEYRSIRAHNTIYVGIEQNTYNGLFSMKNDTRCELISISDRSITLMVKYADVVHLRKIEIEDGRVVIKDRCNKEFIQQFDSALPVSRGYGKICW